MAAPAGACNAFACSPLAGVTAVFSSSQLSMNVHLQVRTVCTIFSSALKDFADENLCFCLCAATFLQHSLMHRLMHVLIVAIGNTSNRCVEPHEAVTFERRMRVE